MNNFLCVANSMDNCQASGRVHGMYLFIRGVRGGPSVFMIFKTRRVGQFSNYEECSEPFPSKYVKEVTSKIQALTSSFFSFAGTGFSLTGSDLAGWTISFPGIGFSFIASFGSSFSFSFPGIGFSLIPSLGSSFSFTTGLAFLSWTFSGAFGSSTGFFSTFLTPFFQS